jgi:hypothetical protein
MGSPETSVFSAPLATLSSKSQRLSRTIAPDLILVTLLIAYFLHFALKSLPAHFRGDDLMNMAHHWSAGMLQSIRANLFFWTSSGRPFGAFYYLPLHHFFDLNPMPYRVVTITLLTATIPIAYSLARSLSSSRWIAFLTIVPWCYHPRLAPLVFVDAFIYDVLCSLFYLAALAWYIGIRETGRSLNLLELFGCLALYVCALNSKEMAVTLPVIVLIYEATNYYQQPNRQTLFRWLARDASPALIAGLITAVYCYAKLYGPEGVYAHPQGSGAYIPHYSWHAFGRANAAFWSQLVYLAPTHVVPPRTVFAAWAAVFLYAFLKRDRLMVLMGCWVVITPLPLAFLVPLRNNSSLSLVLFGWAMILAKLASDLISLISESSIVTGRRSMVAAAMGAIAGGTFTGKLSAAVVAATAGAVAVRLPKAILRVVATLIIAIGLAIHAERQNQRKVAKLLRIGEKESHLIQAFRTLNLRPKPGCRILLVENPFADAPVGGPWYPLFIATLLWHDHSLTIYQEGLHKLNAHQIANMDYILAVHEHKVDVLRQP